VCQDDRPRCHLQAHGLYPSLRSTASLEPVKELLFDRKYNFLDCLGFCEGVCRIQMSMNSA
jgi:hypothetical protein